MNSNKNFTAIIAGLSFFSMISMFSFALSGIILAFLKQFLDINLFFYFNDFPLGIFILTPILIITFFYFMLKSKKN